MIVAPFLAQPSHFRRGEACVIADQGDACVAPTKETWGRRKKNPVR
jgi:hypothetical protein